MSKTIPIYVLLILILASFVTFGILLLRKADAIQIELAGIRNEQRRSRQEARPLRSEVLPVYVVNQP